MKELFTQTTEQYLERFEIIFDKAKSEKMAKSNAVDYYLTLVEDEGVSLETEEIIDLAESYGYDLSDFEELLENNK
jgi:hypothetical protein